MSMNVCNVRETIEYVLLKYIKPHLENCNLQQMVHVPFRSAYGNGSVFLERKERIDVIYQKAIQDFIKEGYIYNIDGNSAFYINPNSDTNPDRISIPVELYYDDIPFYKIIGLMPV